MITINNALHHLFGSTEMWFQFPQCINFQNPYEDACYIGRVRERVSWSEIAIPEEIHCLAISECTGVVWHTTPTGEHIVRRGVWLITPVCLRIDWGNAEERVLVYEAVVAKPRVRSKL